MGVFFQPFLPFCYVKISKFAWFCPFSSNRGRARSNLPYTEFVANSSLSINECVAILSHMNARKATVFDVKTINALVSTYAERDRMLFRSMADIYENLQTFIVVDLDEAVVGCCALEVIWSDLAEIKSLAVDSGQKNKGIGRMLVTEAVKQAKELGLPKVFALTLEPEFFKRQGFTQVPKEELPMKVWSDCARCPKQQHCDEIAMVMQL